MIGNDFIHKISDDSKADKDHKHYSYFCIWAEENSQLENINYGVDNEDIEGYQWSFGNGLKSRNNMGIVIPISCELFSVCLNVSVRPTDTINVEVTKSGTTTGKSVSVTDITDDDLHSVNMFEDDTVGYVSGDILNFRTTTWISPNLLTLSGQVVAWFRKEV